VDEWVRTVHRAREVLVEDPHLMPEQPGPVREVVYESWKRSRLQGLRPDRFTPGYYEDVDLESVLTRVVAPLVEKRWAALDQACSALSLTDHEGRLLRRWVPDTTFAGRLDKLDIVPRFSFAESHVGTSSVIALLKGTPVLVRGPEHFSQVFHSLTCAGAPIVHPVTRRIVGTLDLTCRLADTSPVLLAWVMELVEEVQNGLRDRASRRERLLLDSYLAHNRDVRHPLVTLDRSTIITNAAASRLLGDVDQPMLWEHAACAMREGAAAPRQFLLSNGRSVTIETRPVNDGPEVIGAVLKIKELARPLSTEGRPQRAHQSLELPGLVGRSRRWTQLCAQAAGLRRADRVLVVGEPGTGRRAVATALAGDGPVRVLDAADIDVLGFPCWLQDVLRHLDEPAGTLVLANLHLLDPRQASATERALSRCPSRRVLGTSEAGPNGAGASNSLLHTFVHVLEVPPLRERLDDLALLVATLSKRWAEEGVVVRWMPDAIQALSRLDWSGNVASLESLVRRLVLKCRNGYVGAADLPAEVVAQTTRRTFATMEHAEARAIMQALEAAHGNKHQAAEALGIARSTLYRKVRALGLDLSTAAF
jgi:transcriptional regulator of acetoin/glycerol metabolism